MDNFKEYRKVKKDTYYREFGVIVGFLFLLLLNILKGDYLQSLTVLAIGVACLWYMYFMKKKPNEGNVYVQLDNGLLKYYNNDNLVGECNVKEVEIAYRAYNGGVLLGVIGFELLIIRGEDDVEIWECNNLDYLELYNDIMELQGKEKIDKIKWIR